MSDKVRSSGMNVVVVISDAGVTTTRNDYIVITTDYIVIDTDAELEVSAWSRHEDWWLLAADDYEHRCGTCLSEPGWQRLERSIEKSR